jgi:CPA2 family monovalent cation:H+ antiporter-2
MVFLATKAGFSSALGAFIMGSILAETIDSERIENLTLPIKNFFGAIFFVSVGMMIQLTSLGTYIVPILIISLVVIVGQMFIATGGVLLSGQNLNTAVSSGFSLTQIGEFSYIIGALGLNLGVIDNALYQIIVSASVLTIFATPFMMKLAGPANRFLENKLPLNWQHFLNKDSSAARPVNQDTLWKKLLREMSTIVLIYFFICIMLVNFFLSYALPYIEEWLPGRNGHLVSATFILLALSPFLRAIIIKDHSEEFYTLWKNNKVNRGPLIFTIIVRVLLCAGLIMYILFYLFNTQFVIAFSLALAILMLFIASKRLRRRSRVFEHRFRKNLNEKEKYEESKAPVTKGFVNHVLERDLHLSEFPIQYYYSIVGKTLKELNFRQFFGVSVVTILRGGVRINIPKGEERIYPGDHIVVLGTDKQMELFQQRLEEKRLKYANQEEKTSPEVQMKQIQIDTESHLKGKSIRNSGIQERYNCLLVGVERNNFSMLNPNLDLVLEEDDILWLIGENRNILKIKEI